MPRGFDQHSRSWYRHTSPLPANAFDELYIGEYDDDNSRGEFRVVWHNLGGCHECSPEIRVFNESWPMFLSEEWGDFREYLRTCGKDVTPEQFCDKLRELGFDDRTAVNEVMAAEGKIAAAALAAHERP